MKRLYFVIILFMCITVNAQQSDNLVHLRGVITNEGIECPALRGDDGKLYTLTGITEQLYIGDVLEVVGKPVDVSICMQGTTISIMSYKKLAPSGYSYIILSGELLPYTVGIHNCFALRVENGDIYGIDKGDKMIKIIPGYTTIIVEERPTKDLPCGSNVVKTYNLANTVDD